MLFIHVPRIYMYTKDSGSFKPHSPESVSWLSHIIAGSVEPALNQLKILIPTLSTQEWNAASSEQR